MSESGGKVVKSRAKKRHDPLDKEIRAQNVLIGDERKAKLRKAAKSHAEDTKQLPQGVSRKIAGLATMQQEEMAAENRTEGLDLGGGSDEEFDDEDYEEEVEEVEMDFDEFDGEMAVSEADQAALAMFMGGPAVQSVRLSDIIMQKIKEKEQGMMPGKPQEAQLDPKIIEVYQAIGKVMSRYKSGKLPKAFKIIPTLANWEEILYLTDPDNWSPHTYFVATRLFVGRPIKVVQRFLNLVLLPKVRDDIDDPKTKGLNYHLYMSIKKALFKPAAFYKGFLLPLAEGGCNLTEAWIISSILGKVSIRLLDSAAAMLKLAEMDYAPATSMFLRTLLAKKYALPYSVLDALTSHFLRFMNEEREMPVMWHQSLLVYSQHYKQDLTVEEKDLLKELLKKQQHPQITPEIRRELFFSRSRGEAAPVATEDTEMDMAV